jgi:hypothetical protein
MALAAPAADPWSAAFELATHDRLPSDTELRGRAPGSPNCLGEARTHRRVMSCSCFRERRPQVDSQLAGERPGSIGPQTPEQVVDHVLLAGLAECQAIHRKRISKGIEPVELAAERQREDVPLDGGPVLEWVDPERHDLTCWIDRLSEKKEVDRDPGLPPELDALTEGRGPV